MLSELKSLSLFTLIHFDQCNILVIVFFKAPKHHFFRVGGSKIYQHSIPLKFFQDWWCTQDIISDQKWQLCLFVFKLIIRYNKFPYTFRVRRCKISSVMRTRTSPSTWVTTCKPPIRPRPSTCSCNGNSRRSWNTRPIHIGRSSFLKFTCTISWWKR